MFCGKAGVTFNGPNSSTNYKTGTAANVEATVERIFRPKFSAGVQAYRSVQLPGESGEGAVLGLNEGRVTGLGVTAAYNFLPKRWPPPCVGGCSRNPTPGGGSRGPR